MTPETYSLILSLIEWSEDNVCALYNEGEIRDKLLTKLANARKELAMVYPI